MDRVDLRTPGTILSVPNIWVAANLTLDLEEDVDRGEITRDWYHRRILINPLWEVHW